ncbi:MAG: hypothetical protein C0397_03645 [Odoribacter sp.]|nr:hypothetical protein [Odoribacter sp.]
MKYIFLVGTQHHLVQVNSAIVHFKIPPEDTILLFIKNPKEDISKKLEKYQHLSVAKVFENWVFKDLILDRSKHREFISFIKKLKKEDNQFILFSTVSYETGLLVKSLIKIDKFYLMDDGLGHFTNYFFYKSPKRYIYILILLVKSVLYLKYLKFNTKFIYFTEHDFIVENSERAEKYTIEKHNNPLTHLINDEVIFLGTNLIETKLMVYENYMKLLTSIKKVFKQKKVFYFPHRKEEDSILKDIEAIGYTIWKTNEPFENYFSGLITCPSTICSLYTTAVIQNIAQRFVNIPNLVVMKFNKNLLLNSQKEYEAIYLQMKNIKGIKIIDIS